MVQVDQPRGGLSPPVRGSHFEIEAGPNLWGSIPARAGEPSPLERSGAVTQVYPRPCGGARESGGRQDADRGLSPPVRGSHRLQLAESLADRSIPARAGEPGLGCWGLR